MDKILERVLAEFLIPAFLMFLCMLVAADVLSGTYFDLENPTHRRHVFGNPSLVAAAVLGAYVVNTSLSSILNLLSRKLFWGRVREYLIYRKLNVFKQKRFEEERPSCLWYIRERTRIGEDIKRVKDEKQSLRPFLLEKIKRQHPEEELSNSILDVYDLVRTEVMASGDSAIIGWIQYHWGQLRLARSTLVPALVLLIFLPFAAASWFSPGLLWGIAAFFLSLAFLAIQFMHYYYRERFMIYSMFSYYLVCKGPSHVGRVLPAAGWDGSDELGG